MVNKDDEVTQQSFKYVLVVRAMYLQLSTAYYIFQKDPERVRMEFETFNRDFEELCEVFKTETGCDFDPEKLPPEDLIERCRRASKIMPDVTHVKPRPKSSSFQLTIDQFLANIDLSELHELFVDEGVTMDILITFNDDDLKHLGVKKFGHRRRILHSISSIKSQGKLNIPFIFNQQCLGTEIIRLENFCAKIILIPNVSKSFRQTKSTWRSEVGTKGR